MFINYLEMFINRLEMFINRLTYFSNRLTNQFMRTGLILFLNYFLTFQICNLPERNHIKKNFAATKVT